MLVLTQPKDCAVSSVTPFILQWSDLFISLVLLIFLSLRSEISAPVSTSNEQFEFDAAISNEIKFASDRFR